MITVKKVRQWLLFMCVLVLALGQQSSKWYVCILSGPPIAASSFLFLSLSLPLLSPFFSVSLKSCNFTSLREALSIDWGKKPAKYFRRTPTTFFITQSESTDDGSVLLYSCQSPLLFHCSALQAFRDKHGTNPSCCHDNSDRASLLGLKEEVARKCNVSSQLIAEDFIDYCNSELSPVCAIVGGVLAQEVIKVQW